MNIRVPNPSTASVVLKKYFAGIGISMTLAQAQEAVARLNGYPDWRALKADKHFADPLSLQAISSNEFELRPKEHSAWIGVDNISVAVRRTDEGVIVDCYAKGHEDDAICGTGLMFDEAQEYLDSEPLDDVDCVPEGDSDTSSSSGENFAPEDFSWLMLLAFREMVTHVKIQGKDHLIARILEIREDGLWVQYEPDSNGNTGEPFLYERSFMETTSEVRPGVFGASTGNDFELLYRTSLGNYLVYSQVLRKMIEPAVKPRRSPRY